MLTAMSRPIPRRFLFGTLAAAPLAGSQFTRAAEQYVHARKVLLWESTRREFREALESGALKALIVPVGSTEQHNEHLAMIHDTASVTLVAQQAALSLYPQAMVATPVSVGISPHWMDRKGTLSLRRETFLAVVFDICESLTTHGVKNILVLNGHGGNARPLAEAMPDFRQKLGINVRFNSYWDAYTPEIIKKHMETNKAPAHAAEFETSFAMAAFPERIHWEGVDYAQAKPRLNIKDPGSARDDELFHREAKLAATWKGEAMIKIAVEWVAVRLRQMIAES